MGLAVLLFALLHEKIETLIRVVYSLLVHTVFHWLQIQTGSHGGWMIAMSLF